MYEPHNKRWGGYFMKYLKSLYISLVLIMLVILVSTPMFDEAYKGMGIFVCLCLYLIGTFIALNIKQSG